jgi:ribosomal protein L37AE/L43A
MKEPRAALCCPECLSDLKVIWSEAFGQMWQCFKCNWIWNQHFEKHPEPSQRQNVVDQI